MKNILQFLIILGLLLVFSGRGLQAQAVTGVTLNTNTLSLALFDSEQLIATVTPANATEDSVTWQSSNSRIISVDAEGYVYAIHDGVATITVKTIDGGFTDQCVVTCQVNNAANIIDFSFVNESHVSIISDESTKVIGYMPYGTDVSNLTVDTYQISPGATIDPLPETIHDFTDTVLFVVTAPNGITQNIWKVFPNVLPDLSNTQEIKLTFSTAPQGWIDDTVSWVEAGIHFHVDYPNPSDPSWPPSASIDMDQDYSNEMGISLFPATLNFYLQDTTKMIVASSMYIFENCGTGCTQVYFSGESSNLWNIPQMTKDYYFFDLATIKATEGSLASFESSFSGITFWIANKDGSVNQAPVANAGIDQMVFSNDSVYLNGTDSYDVDGDPLSYLWMAPGGISLTDNTSATPAFKAPDVTQTTVFSFALIVNDGQVNSLHDTVLITVEHQNQQPVAWIDIDSIPAFEENTAYIEGHYSYDPDGDSLSFHWWTDPGSGIVILDSTAMDISCTVPTVINDTIMQVYLKVDDGQLTSSPDTAYLYVSNINHAPMADIYQHTQFVNDGDTVYLDGSASSDPDGDTLSYQWTGPNSIYIVENGDSAWFIAPIVQNDTPLIISLIVNDGQINSPPAYDTVWVQHVNHIPIAESGYPIELFEGDSSYLYGSLSYDIDGDSLSYSWNMPAGFWIADSTQADSRFSTPMVQYDTIFNCILKVFDGQLWSAPDTCKVTVKKNNQAPVANAGIDQMVFSNDSVYLNGTDSYDVDGDPLSYLWMAPGGISLTDNTSATPAFKAPDVTQTTVFSFTLIVNDGQVNSLLDTVLITVEHPNQQPVAWIDIDSIPAFEENTAYIEGHYSYDSDGDSLSFHWWTDPGSGIVILDSTAMDISCTLPSIINDTIMQVYLKVDDGQLTSLPDTAYLYVSNINHAPIADIYQHTEFINDGDTVYLDGSASFDPDGDLLSYQWNGPNSIYIEDNGESAWFIAPIVQNDTPFIISLIVNDGQINSSPAYDTVWVQHVNHIPIAESGYPIELFEGESSYLYGSLSYDIDGDSLSYSWDMPAGFWIADSTQADSPFEAPMVQYDTTFNCVLKVFDGQLWSAPDTCRVTVKNQNHAPIAEIVSTEPTFYGVSMNEGDSLWIDGSPSYDPDGDSINFIWMIPEDFDPYYTDSVKTLVVAPEVSLTTSFNASLFVSDGFLQGETHFIIQVLDVNSTDVPQNDQMEVYLYPNPTKGTLHISAPEFDGKKGMLYIYDITGHLMIAKKMDQPMVKVDMSQFTNGIYFVKITNHYKVITRKIIKQ